MERELMKCLFCAVDIPRVKSEVFITPDADDHELSNFGSEAKDWFGVENPSIQKNLRGFFILKKILKISEDSLTKFLIRNEGKFETRLWANVCVSCGAFVRRFHQTLVQISRLERQLEELEEELKTRIESSHDERDEQEDSSDWSWIRSEVLGYHSPGSFVKETSFQMPVIIGTHSTSTSIVPVHFNPELDQDSEEFSTSHIDEDFKIVLEPADNEQEHPTSLFLEEDQDDHDYVPPSLEPPRRSIKTPYVHIYNHRCQQCPYKSDKRVRLQNHLRLHEEGSGGIPCVICGCFVHFKKMTFHRTCFHKKKKKPVQSKRSIPNLKRRDVITIKGPDFHQCTKCPYINKEKRRVAHHMKTHEPGSGAVPCRVCGWFVMPDWLHHHHGLFHSDWKSKKKPEYELSLKKAPSQSVVFYNESEEDPDEEESLFPVFKPEPKRYLTHKCPQCPFGTTKRDRLEAHLKNHAKGSEATAPCRECGAFILKTRMRQHLSLSHNIRLPVAKNQDNLPPPPNLKQFYTMGRNGTSSSYHYKCLQCPYKSTGLARIKVHIAVHNAGSGKTCPICGILVDPKKMVHHQSQQHGRSMKKGGKFRQTLLTPSSSNDC